MDNWFQLTKQYLLQNRKKKLLLCSHGTGREGHRTFVTPERSTYMEETAIWLETEKYPKKQQSFDKDSSANGKHLELFMKDFFYDVLHQFLRPSSAVENGAVSCVVNRPFVWPTRLYALVNSVARYIAKRRKGWQKESVTAEIVLRYLWTGCITCFAKTERQHCFDCEVPSG